MMTSKSRVYCQHDNSDVENTQSNLVHIKMHEPKRTNKKQSMPNKRKEDNFITCTLKRSEILPLHLKGN